MIIHQKHLCTRLLVWAPKYAAKYGAVGEAVALVHKKKVDFASPVILIDFKAKHLQGLRFCIRKQEAQRHPVTTNGVAEMYAIPMSHFESWETAQEARDIALSVFGDS